MKFHPISSLSIIGLILIYSILQLSLAQNNEAQRPDSTDPSALSFIEISNEMNTDQSNVTNKSIQIGDGTCHPPCANGGYCKSSLCFCRDFTFGVTCEQKINYTPRIHVFIFFIICLAAFILGGLSSLCCRLVYDQRQDDYEEEELFLYQKRRDIMKFSQPQEV